MLSGCWVADEGSARWPGGGSILLFLDFTFTCPTFLFLNILNYFTATLLLLLLSRFSHVRLPELTQTHVRWVGDAIQPPHRLSSPSPPAFNLSQHEGLFQWVSSLHQVAKILEENMLLQPLRVSAPHLQEAGTDRFLCPFPLSNNILLK